MLTEIFIETPCIVYCSISYSIETTPNFVQYVNSYNHAEDASWNKGKVCYYLDQNCLPFRIIEDTRSRWSPNLEFVMATSNIKNLLSNLMLRSIRGVSMASIPRHFLLYVRLTVLVLSPNMTIK